MRAMKRTQIAPTLADLVARTAPQGVATAQAGAELRALLAVARAVGRDGKPFADAEGPACGCGPCRAYARLRRLSAPAAAVKGNRKLPANSRRGARRTRT